MHNLPECANMNIQNGNEFYSFLYYVSKGHKLPESDNIYECSNWWWIFFVLVIFCLRNKPSTAFKLLIAKVSFFLRIQVLKVVGTDFFD